MAATAGRVTEVEEDQEALFSAYSSASYYVQSPSATSQPNSNGRQRNRETPTSHPTLSRYPFSICSSHSSLHGRMNIADDLHLSDGDGAVKTGRNRLVIITGGGGGEERKSAGLWMFLSLDPSSSWCHVGAQVTCRFLMSLGVALLVFYLATRPPTPIVSVEVTGIQQFELAEGIDATAVPTKVLTCNCSVDVKIENHSKVYGLRSHPPTMEVIFGRMRIATSQQDHGAFAEADSSSAFRMHVGTKGRPVYGAGRAMQDMLESDRGLPLAIRVRSSSSYRLAAGLIRRRFHHSTGCVVVILATTGDERRNFPAFNSTCSTITRCL